jgi:hypothetical protein
VHFGLGTPIFSQVRDPAPSESSSTNKNDTEEYEGNNESMITNKDDESQKDEINDEEIHSRRASDDSLKKPVNALTGMSVTTAADSKKRYDVAAESLLKVVDEHLSTEAVSLTQQNFAAEGY